MFGFYQTLKIFFICYLKEYILNTANEQKKIILSNIVLIAKQKLSVDESNNFIIFLNKYYQNVSSEDLKDRDINDLFGAAISHWRLGCNRAPKEVKIEVFNPTLEHHGWQTPHTVIQIVISDMPFLIDTIKMQIDKLGYSLHYLINLAGIKITRDATGDIANIDQKSSGSSKEEFLAFEISHQNEDEVITHLTESIAEVLNDVVMCVEDWGKMKQCMEKSIADISNLTTGFEQKEVSETISFLQWMLEYFTFVGVREYVAKGTKDDKALHLVKGSSLGVLRDDSDSQLTRLYSDLPPDTKKLALSKQMLMISKTNTPSTIHRPAYTDLIGVKKFNSSGNVIGETRFVGLFTSDAYDSDPSKIPILRNKVQEVILRSDLQDNLHLSKRLMHILKNLPRDELFQISLDELCNMSMGILDLQDRKKTKLFVRRDIFNKFVSCLVYVPRDNFNTEIRMQMEEILLQEFGGIEIIATPSFSESLLARVHFIIRIDAKEYKEYDYTDIENKIIKITRSWSDEFCGCILDKYGEFEGNSLNNNYAKSFPESYKETYPAAIGVCDLDYITKLSIDNELNLSIYRSVTMAKSYVGIKLFQAYKPIPLSDALPILENMSLKVITSKSFELKVKSGESIWVSDFEMHYKGNGSVDLAQLGSNFQESFKRIWHGDAEDDKFNSLILSAKLSWKQISMIRAYARYLRQIQFNLSEQYIQDCLAENEDIVKYLVDLFEYKHDIKKQDHALSHIEDIEKEIDKKLDTLQNIDDDRILRKFLEVITATVRTNYFQLDEDTGECKSYISLKLNPKEISDMPLPAPKHEIFVYSPRFEGVHLRFDSIARGGLRWSDRREDFRTEVLGLMKAQQVKNAIISPSGAKGGFVPKCISPEDSRDAVMAEGISCYKSYLSGLLDVTDNFIGGKIVKRDDTVCLDGDDLYLVVAADKGTASFSDIANSISEKYNYWLKDAFASGGSTGYDHKKMGITAKGAWESVKRHFIELNIDIDKPFTVAGIGDMSGDVFGNGLLLSNQIKLIAAFNHNYIFIDPNPDVLASFKERTRMFNLPVSQWIDYDPNIISKGGGIYSRRTKYINLSDEARLALGIQEESLRPDELIKRILSSKVDLLWNGGIGTYIKSSSETHQDVGDKANDQLRVNGEDLNAKVVAEGGNLGATQLGRVEYELHKGRMNTDFIDNSAGVDCSDHEVNIKILLNDLVSSSDITLKQRNELLKEMTDDVSNLVLYNNFKQNIAISLTGFQLKDYLDLVIRFMENGEKSGKIDRKLEFLPSKKEIFARKSATGKSFTRPELSILLAYSKIMLCQDILSNDFDHDDKILDFAMLAFPMSIRSKYENNIRNHYLIREIAATKLSDKFVTDMGISFVQQLQDEFNASSYTIIKCYIAAQEILDLDSLVAAVDKKSKEMLSNEYIDTLALIRVSIRKMTRWFVSNLGENINISKVIADYSSGVKNIADDFIDLASITAKKDYNKVRAKFVKMGLEDAIADRLAMSDFYLPILNIIEGASYNNANLLEFGAIYFKLSCVLRVDWFRHTIYDFSISSRWDIIAKSTAQFDLDMHQREIASAIYKFNQKSDKKLTVEKQIAYWHNKHKHKVEYWLNNLSNLDTSESIDFAIITVIMRSFFELAKQNKEQMN